MAYLAHIMRSVPVLSPKENLSLAEETQMHHALQTLCLLQGERISACSHHGGLTDSREV